MKFILLILAIIIGFWLQHSPEQKQPENTVASKTQKHQPSASTQTTRPTPSTDFESLLQQAFQNHQSNLQVRGSGTVSKTLPDDNKGSRHQRFILRLSSGQTLLVAHNIDLAPKIRGLKKGDTVEFNGEYEWSEQGGVLHWTHHDPTKRHADGWLRHNNQTYQ